jgi:hypothetical protein
MTDEIQEEEEDGEDEQHNIFHSICTNGGKGKKDTDNTNRFWRKMTSLAAAAAGE